jgi:RNA-binding protein
MTEPLSKQQIRQFKSTAQRLEPTIHVGKAGLTPAFLSAVDLALTGHELIKVRFTHFKEERKTVAAEMAEKTHSHLVTIVGHVAVLYRKRPAPAAESP